MKKLSGFPIWMLFVFTCFLNWAAILTAGIISGNKKWILYGGLYALPFVFLFMVAANDPDNKVRRDVETRLKSGIELSEAEQTNFAQAIAAIAKIDENKELMESISEYQAKKELKDANADLEEDIDNNIEAIHPQIHSWYETLAISLWLFATLAAFIHAWVIKPKYWKILQEKENIKRRTLAEEQKFAIQNPKENILHQKLQREVFQTKTEILKKLDSSSSLDNYLTGDIKRMTENYSEQINLLVEKDKKLTLQMSPLDAEKARANLQDLKRQLDEANNVALIAEIQTAIASKKKLVDSYDEMMITHDTIKLRLNTAVSSLKQVKFDLMKLESVFSDEQKKQFFIDFEDKANELSGYVEAVKESYE